jgi:hypothetical protein
MAHQQAQVGMLIQSAAHFFGQASDYTWPGGGLHVLVSDQ